MTDATRVLMLSALDCQPGDYFRAPDETLVEIICHRLIDQGAVVGRQTALLQRYHQRHGALAAQPEVEANQEKADGYRQAREDACKACAVAEGRR